MKRPPRPGSVAPGTDGPSCFLLYRHERPQLLDLLRDIKGCKARSITDFQALLNRCYATGLYDKEHLIIWWASSRELAAQSVVMQATERGYAYNARARQFREVLNQR